MHCDSSDIAQLGIYNSKEKISNGVTWHIFYGMHKHSQHVIGCHYNAVTNIAFAQSMPYRYAVPFDVRAGGGKIVIRVDDWTVKTVPELWSLQSVPHNECSKLEGFASVYVCVCSGSYGLVAPVPNSMANRKNVNRREIVCCNQYKRWYDTSIESTSDFDWSFPLVFNHTMLSSLIFLNQLTLATLDFLAHPSSYPWF